ncbi:putative anti-virus transcriptional factor [Heracleum sosnowskyi]|uniref:Anti-virus transcriptional factor n=1 Tax=Heracleum sosnowskyi TaxID=360622 RepID=A0AAD8MHS6_9APIA|nr:putative anti-virus transcriptional factor [Heracleum sosnowskyi]
MVPDSIPPAPNSKDVIKKKRSNKAAKLKQSKLDARRKQWILQVMNHGPKVNASGGREMNEDDGRDQGVGVFGENDGSVHNYSDSESSSHSRGSHIGCVGGSNCSGTNFSGSSRSSSSTSGTSYTGNISDREEDAGLDNWEAVADALAATGEKQEQHDHKIMETPVEDTSVTQLDPLPKVVNQPNTTVDVPKPKIVNRQAWRPDDAFRPRCLPNLVKQNSFPMKANRRYGNVGAVWVRKNIVSAPSSCPICCEDLDVTDSSFLPCSCGFQLCLFCHKRILEEDGRCPGCRKYYENDPVKGGVNSDLGGSCATLRLARSCSMITKS